MTVILSLLKSVLISFIISQGKKLLFGAFPDWNDEEKTRQFFVTKHDSLRTLVNSTQIKWDDRLADLYQKVVNNPEWFHVVYEAVNGGLFTLADSAEPERKRLRIAQRLRSRFNLSESTAERESAELMPLVEAISLFRSIL